MKFYLLLGLGLLDPCSSLLLKERLNKERAPAGEGVKGCCYEPDYSLSQLDQNLVGYDVSCCALNRDFDRQSGLSIAGYEGKAKRAVDCCHIGGSYYDDAQCMMLPYCYETVEFGATLTNISSGCSNFLTVPCTDPRAHVFVGAMAINTDITGEIELLMIFPTSCYPCPLSSILCPYYLWHCANLRALWWIKDHYDGPPTGITIGNCVPLGFPSNNGQEGWAPQTTSHSWMFQSFKNQTARTRIKYPPEAHLSSMVVNRDPWCMNGHPSLLYPGTNIINKLLPEMGGYCPICFFFYMIATSPNLTDNAYLTPPPTDDCMVLCHLHQQFTDNNHGRPPPDMLY